MKVLSSLSSPLFRKGINSDVFGVAEDPKKYIYINMNMEWR